MSSYNEINQTIFPFKNNEVEATFYAPTKMKMKTVILYFHGGGFVFGNRNDLPSEYIELLTAQGIGIVAVDYPLAPETKLPVIIEITNKITTWFVDHFLSSHHLEHYFIMGRSAGSYLALSNGIYTEQLSIRPIGIIALYGYFNLTDATFNMPSRYYLKYPSVSDRVVAAQIKEEPFLYANNPNRYLLYLAARQKGDWLNLFLTAPDQKKKLSLSTEQLKRLPSLFLSASTKDMDVPVRQSRQLANLHPDTTLHLVDVDEHDFDRTHIDTLGIELYRKISSWIIDLLD